MVCYIYRRLLSIEVMLSRGDYVLVLMLNKQYWKAPAQVFVQSFLWVVKEN
jgi:hypothetical protein